jgi:hypothetical protein
MNARSRREAVDWAVAVMLALAMAVAAGLSGPVQPAVRAVAVLSAAGLLALAVRRRRPMAALAAVIARTSVGFSLSLERTVAMTCVS